MVSWFLGLAALLAADLEAARTQEPGVGPDPAGEAQPDREAIHSLWRNTLEIAWGWKGPYPLDRAGKAALLRDLARAASRLRWSDPEARLLRWEVLRAVQHVERILPLEEAGWPGESLRHHGPSPALGWFEARLPSFKALLEDGPPGPGYLEELLPHILEATDRERDRLLLSLEVAAKDVAQLAEAGRLSESEMGLLRIALAELVDKAGSFRTVGLVASCYISMNLDLEVPSLDRIQRRLPLLEKLISEKRIPGDAFARILGGLTRDLGVLVQLESLNSARWAQAAARVGELIRTLLPSGADPGSPLVDDPGWAEIAAALSEALPAGDRKGGRRDPRPDLNAVDRKVSSARLAASRLAIQGRISWPELQLIHAELEWHRQRLDRLRWRDPGAPRFLDTDTYSQALASTRKLSWAVPFVPPHAREGRIRGAVLEAVLPGLRAARNDLQGIEPRDQEWCARHPAFPGLEERASTAIQELERLLAAAPKPCPRNGR